MVKNDSRPVTRILVAPDKFKGTLSAPEAAAAIAAGLKDADPALDIHCMPLADGGEGTLDVFLAVGGTEHSATVTGPLGEKLEASWVGLGGLAVIELAQVCGLGLVARPDAASAWEASSFGAGELIREVVSRGYQEILVGVGGVASTDGGMGALRALGLKFLRSDGKCVESLDLSEVVILDGTDMREVLDGVDIRIATDVTHVLTGAEGAAAVFAPQKGADAATVQRLEARLQQWAGLLTRSFGHDVRELSATGAAGGFASGFLAAAAATIESGLDAVAEISGLDEQLANTDLVIVAEGKLDGQSLQGKAPIAVARRAKAAGIPVIALAGLIEVDEQQLASNGVGGAADLYRVARDAQDAMEHAALRLRELTKLVIEPYLSVSV